jgi:WD40 repeat protein
VGGSDVGTEEDARKIEALLNICEAPEDDLEYFLDRWIEGSCEWVLKNKLFQSWRESASPTPQVLWLRGLPGTGKSVLSASVIQYLREKGVDCSFYFFRYGNQTRTSLNAFLRSMAYQIACLVPDYGRKLAKLSDNGFNFEKAESRMLWQKLFIQALFKVNLYKPLYWVIDGLDESDSPTTLLNLLSSISSSNLALRILFVSRKSQTLSMSFERLSASINTQYLSLDDSVHDLKLYVDKEMEFMRATPKFKERVTSTIMDMANGNFLWVHLVLQEIMLCFTEADIEKALRELPAELESLYQRMEASLAKQPRVSDQNLAQVILTWASCSRRPLNLSELSQVLLPEHQPVLDLQHTISQVCGEFVNIDAKGNVTMIHQTARDYLTKTPGLRFSIYPSEAHYTLFKQCMSFLSSANSRTRVEQVLSQPFLLYAATSWPHHLSLSSAAQDRASLLLLAKFLRGPSVLTWIHCLALAGQLRILVLASKSLMSFLEKRARIDKEESPITHPLREKETIELWATDLIKVVGKFGTHLVSHPKSIYKLVPPFCPRDSIMHRQFGPKALSSTLRVSGFSNNSWDDNLAKFSVGRDSQGVKIKCLDNYFAILVTDGTVILYHSITCEESRRFPHGERVLAMQFNNAGDKLVTNGFRTTRVWSVSSARQLHCISNPSGTKALAVTFATNDTAILTCSEDRAIRQWSLLSSLDAWEEILGDDAFGSHHHNSPKCVAFNHEGTQVALAYRGFPLSVWGIDYPGIIGTCERPGNVGHDLWTGVDRVGWNPVTGHVVGIYSDGCVFKWHPEENDNQELKTVALEIECSPDGNLFVTSSSDGTLRIWNFHHFALIYQLSCTSPVTDLAIDPDSRRIYDLRDFFCNVWEPNSLIRLAEADEKASETSSAMGSSGQLSMASEVSFEMLEPITALAISPQTSAYCVGNDEGTVAFSASGSNNVVELSQGFMTVSHVVWSEDESTIATADLSGRITVRALDFSSILPRDRVLFQTSAQGSIYQILLSPKSNYLLVHTSQSAQIWSMSSKKLVAICVLQNCSMRWANDPHAEDILLCFGFVDVRIFNWSNFKEVRSLQIHRGLIDVVSQGLAPQLFRKPSENGPLSPEEFETLVDKTFVTPDRSIMLIETSRASDHCRRKKQFMIIRTFELLSNGSENIITPSPLSDEILTRIEMPLGFLDGDSIKTFWSFSSRSASDPTSSPGAAVLAFLNKDFWVCTGLLNVGGTGIMKGVKRHFFLPRDWLNMECLELAIMTKEGTLLCPRNGEVAVVRDGLKEEWIG